MFDVDTLLGQHLPRLASQPRLRPLMRQGLSWLLHEEAFTRFAARHPHLRGLDFVEQALTELHFDYRVSEAELERCVAAVSSHSIRVGVAQDNFAVGESLPAIMQAYRWRDPQTVMR